MRHLHQPQHPPAPALQVASQEVLFVRSSHRQMPSSCFLGRAAFSYSRRIFPRALLTNEAAQQEATLVSFTHVPSALLMWVGARPVYEK